MQWVIIKELSMRNVCFWLFLTFFIFINFTMLSCPFCQKTSKKESNLSSLILIFCISIIFFFTLLSWFFCLWKMSMTWLFVYFENVNKEKNCNDRALWIWFSLYKKLFFSNHFGCFLPLYGHESTVFFRRKKLQWQHSDFHFLVGV